MTPRRLQEPWEQIFRKDVKALSPWFSVKRCNRGRIQLRSQMPKREADALEITQPKPETASLCLDWCEASRTEALELITKDFGADQRSPALVQRRDDTHPRSPDQHTPTGSPVCHLEERHPSVPTAPDLQRRHISLPVRDSLQCPAGCDG